MKQGGGNPGTHFRGLIYAAITIQAIALFAIAMQWPYSVRNCDSMGAYFQEGYGARANYDAVHCLYRGELPGRIDITMPTFPVFIAALAVLTSVAVTSTYAWKAGRADASPSVPKEEDE
ncbi:hypothetical protein [Actinomadura logoneensis]|uniref:hypothetical protein n=1 Tax=Actinomadura logoneensis TaxID=2293572 RepID=UPI0011C149EF|nr:hypothetical protein [Actinomadura logoneensis]